MILKEHESICIWTEIWLTIHEWRFANSTLFPPDPPAAPRRCQAVFHRCPLRNPLSSSPPHTTSAAAPPPLGPSWAERSGGTRHRSLLGPAGEHQGREPRGAPRPSWGCSAGRRALAEGTPKLKPSPVNIKKKKKRKRNKEKRGKKEKGREMAR